MNINDELPLAELSIRNLYMPDVDCVYEIPIYQRNYAWERDEIETLIQDVFDKFIKDPESYYYIGTLVTYKKDENYYEVIDGQQRLTTIRIILGVFYTLKSGENNILTSPILSKLTFRARDSSDNALKNIPSGSGNSHNERKNTSIDLGYGYALEKIKKDIIPNVADLIKFVDFFLDKVRIIHYQVPIDVDLNHYFEIMNSRGEQLEKHEIVKSKIIEFVSKNKSKRFVVNHIWNACSDMNNYVQHNLFKENEDIAKFIFAKCFDCFKLDNLNDFVSKHEFDDCSCFNSITLTEVLKQEYKAEKNKENEGIKDEFQPIIDFSNFLLIVLKVTEFMDEGYSNEKLAALDDKELIDEFDRYIINQARADTFIVNLLKARYFLDNFIVHHNVDDERIDSNPWVLKKCIREWNQTSNVYQIETRNLTENQTVNEDLGQLLSMFEVTYSAKQRKNYLFYCLYYLIKNWKGRNCSDKFIERYHCFVSNLAYCYFNCVYLDNIEKQDDASFRSDNFDGCILDELDDMDDDRFREKIPHCDSEAFLAIYGDGKTTASGSEECKTIPLYVFNYLDYRIWKKYCEVRGKPSHQMKPLWRKLGCDNCDRANFDSFNKFYFSRTRKSLEHYLPQKNIMGVDCTPEGISYDVAINCLGNYGMIGSRANSSGSNWNPLTKIDHYLDGSQKIDPVSVASLKFLIMMWICARDKKWEFDQIQSHQECMLQVLFDEDG